MILEKELTHDEAYELWMVFGKVIGMENLRDLYGHHWVRKPFYGERIWTFFDKGEESISPIIGWCALRPDPDPIIWQISGIFPEFNGHGYVKQIFKWCIQKGFEIWPEAEYMVYCVSKNSPFCVWLKHKNPERVVGEICIPPPGYIIFGVKNSNKEIPNGPI